MVFVKSGFKKRYRKRYYKKKLLKKFNIFSKKSAKSQAKQIYALNKKVNKLAYHTRPETQICQCMLYKHYLTSDGTPGAPGVSNYTYHFMLYKGGLFDENHCNYQMKGHMLRPYNVNLYGIFGNKNYCYVMNSGTTSAATLPAPLTGYLRIIVCKLTGQQYNIPSKITKSFDPNSIDGDYGLIAGPLIDDISSSVKIVENRVIKVDEKTPNKMFKITLKNPGVVSEGAVSSGGLTTYKNDYMIYFQYWCPAVLNVEDYGQAAPKHIFEISAKYAFVDEA